MKLLPYSLILCLLLLPAPIHLSARESEPETRTWTSHTGSQFVGYVKEIDANQVVLTNSTRRKITLTKDQLSPLDRAYLAALERARHAAALEFFRAGEFDADTLPSQIDIKGLRHVVQRENFCVPASAEMLLRFLGFNYDQDYIAQITSRDSARSGGTNFRDLSQALSNLGIDSVMLRENNSIPGLTPERQLFNGIRTALAQGRPVLISYENSDIGHAVVVVGYDDRRRCFWVMDPARGKRAERLDYQILEDILTGVMVAIPRPASSTATAFPKESPASTEFLSTVSNLLRSTPSGAFDDLVDRLAEARIPAEARDANRVDLQTSQGQTRSFARGEGVSFVRLALDRGLVVAAPQTFDNGPGMILIYGTEGKEFRAVEYHPGGIVQRGNVRPLDFSLRWLWREEGRFHLPLIEIEVTPIIGAQDG